MGDDPEAAPRKRARGELKRVAEIVMVLSAMGELRGGRGASTVERSLAAEARERLAGVCEAARPKDLFSREAVRVVVEDLGLNRSRDPMMGFRPPKMSIAEKVLLTKRKMEESREHAAHSSVCSSQLPPMGAAASPESHSTMFHGAPRFLPEKTSPLSLSAGGFQTPSPLVHVPSPASMPSSLKLSHADELQHATNSMRSAAGSIDRNSPSVGLPRAEVAHFRLDPRSSGPAYITQLRAADYLPEKSSMNSMQSTSTSSFKFGQSVTSEEVNAVQSSSQISREHDPKTSLVQAVPGNVLIGPVHGITFVHPPTFFPNHNEIARHVQQVLQQKAFDHPSWAPPSLEYMNTSLVCQICKNAISDVESVLVCDACEKGTHLKCLQSYGNKGIPKLEWHCPKCLISSSGKTLPPKYGRVTRSTGASKPSSNIVGTQASSNTVITQTSSDKRAEGNPDSKINEQKSTPNGTSVFAACASTIGSNSNELVVDTRTTKVGDTEGLNSAKKLKIEDRIFTGSCTDHLKQRAGPVDVDSVTSGLQSESPNGHIENSGLSLINLQGAKSESELQAEVLPRSYPEHQLINVDNISDQSSLPNNSQSSKKEDFRAEDSADQLHESTGVNEMKVPLELKQTSECTADCYTRFTKKETSLEIPNGDLNNGAETAGSALMSSSSLQNVEWVGDILKVIDGRTYYHSCRVDGMKHNVQDHIIISSEKGRSLPSKLQTLWEDNETGTKWAVVNPFYFPNDLQEVVSHPSKPELNEVYASSHESTIIAASIIGPCKVLLLPTDEFREESSRSTQEETNNSLLPTFMCKWRYDKSKGIFQAVTC